MQISMLAGSEKYLLSQWIRRFANVKLRNVRPLLWWKVLWITVLMFNVALTANYLVGIMASYEGSNTEYIFDLSALLINAVLYSVTITVLCIRLLFTELSLLNYSRVEGDRNSIADALQYLPNPADAPEPQTPRNPEPPGRASLEEKNTSLPSQISALPDGLSTREAEILVYFALGRSPRQIAAIVNISHETVQTHLSNICVKAQKSRRELPIYAVQKQLISVTPSEVTSTINAANLA